MRFLYLVSILFLLCSGTALSENYNFNNSIATVSSINNSKFKNPYTGENAIASKAVTSSFTCTRGCTKTLSNSYIKRGEIMFFDLGGENKTAVLSNIGDSNGNDKNEWVFIDAPVNY